MKQILVTVIIIIVYTVWAYQWQHIMESDFMLTRLLTWLIATIIIYYIYND